MYKKKNKECNVTDIVCQLCEKHEIFLNNIIMDNLWIAPIFFFKFFHEICVFLYFATCQVIFPTVRSFTEEGYNLNFLMNDSRSSELYEFQPLWWIVFLEAHCLCDWSPSPSSSLKMEFFMRKEFFFFQCYIFGMSHICNVTYCHCVVLTYLVFSLLLYFTFTLRFIFTAELLYMFHD